ncbi:MAG: hypothetical protein HGA19_04175 [Oscillochloris sp.]|nr:hypothetical protein [Oscillochloris sp.]
MPTSTRSQRRRQPVRTQQRRSPARVIEPPDYSRDYAYVKHDLLMITVWGGLLFVGMIAAYFIV